MALFDETPFGAPTTSTAPAAGAMPMMTPDQINRLRIQAEAMQQMPKEGIKHWTQGLAHLLNVINGNRFASQAMETEAAGRKDAAGAISSIYSPYLGSPKPIEPTSPIEPPKPRAEGGDGLVDYANRLFHIESGGDPNATSPGGRNKGLAQFSPDLEAKYGITDANRTDPHAQLSAVMK